MKKINLSITGGLGRMGQQLIKSYSTEKNFKLVSITESKIINKKLKLKSKTVLSVILPKDISRIRKKINAKNKGKIRGTNILNGL